MTSSYKKAKAWYIVRYRFVSWLRSQVPGFVVGVILSLAIFGYGIGPLIQYTWEKAYVCEQHADSFTCRSRGGDAD